MSDIALVERQPERLDLSVELPGFGGPLKLPAMQGLHELFLRIPMRLRNQCVDNVSRAMHALKSDDLHPTLGDGDALWRCPKFKLWGGRTVAIAFPYMPYEKGTGQIGVIDSPHFISLYVDEAHRESIVSRLLAAAFVPYYMYKLEAEVERCYKN
jgi:hypothetical protein